MTKPTNEPDISKEEPKFQDPTPELELLAIDLDSDQSDGDDPDNYAATASAADTPSSSAPVSRTFQSEEAFQAQKASYTAKHDDNSSYTELMKMFPLLSDHHHEDEGIEITNGTAISSDSTSAIEEELQDEKPVTLDKRAVQRLGYAVGELYLDRRYEEVIGLCERVWRFCDWRDSRLREDLCRWEGRCRARIEGR